MPQLEQLLDGYRRFRAGPYMDQRRRYDLLAQDGQHPKVMVIACSDSRTDPAQVFDTAPGQMFVVRNVAGLVPPYEDGGGQHAASAAIEYAVTQLEVHYIVVFGHGRCGGIAASLSGAFDAAGPGEGLFVGKWMAMIAPARDRVREALQIAPDIDGQRALEHAAIRLSLANLRSFPFVAAAERDGRLALRGAWFDIAEGQLQLLDPAVDRFVAVPVAL